MICTGALADQLSLEKREEPNKRPLKRPLRKVQNLKQTTSVSSPAEGARLWTELQDLDRRFNQYAKDNRLDLLLDLVECEINQVRFCICDHFQETGN